MGQICPTNLERASLSFLLHWVRSPLADCTLDLSQIAGIDGYGPDRLTWLIENEYITRFHKGVGVSAGPGPKRKKVISAKEKERAKAALKRSNLKPSTIRFYQSVLGIRQPEEYFRVNPKAMPSMLEAIFGLPNRVNATKFAKENGLPPSLAKAWFRDLIGCGRGRIVVVKGVRMIDTRSLSGRH